MTTDDLVMMQDDIMQGLDDGLVEDLMTEDIAMLFENDENLMGEFQQRCMKNPRQISDSTRETCSTDCTDSAMTLDGDNDDNHDAAAGESSAMVDAATPNESTVITPAPIMTGRPPIMLYLSCNPDHLSQYQCLIRKHIQLFEANQVEIQGRIKGRNKPIVLGQVGIRCQYCAHVFPAQDRARGAMYYPHKLTGIYQAAQILSQGHLLELCPFVPDNVRQEMKELKKKKSFATAGKEYWAKTAEALGVYEDQHGLRFLERLSMVKFPSHSH